MGRVHPGGDQTAVAADGSLPVCPERESAKARRRARKRQNALLWEVWRRTHWHVEAPMEAHDYEWHEDWPADLEPFRSYFVAIVEATQALIADGASLRPPQTSDDATRSEAQRREK